MEIMPGTGDIFSFLDMFNATGATISTVATLSTKAEIIPANKARDMMAHFTLWVFSIIRSASRDGIFDSINRDTTPMVPAIIMMTFQSTVLNTFPTGSIPRMTNTAADPSAI